MTDIPLTLTADGQVPDLATLEKYLLLRPSHRHLPRRAEAAREVASSHPVARTMIAVSPNPGPNPNQHPHDES